MASASRTGCTLAGPPLDGYDDADVASPFPPVLGEFVARYDVPAPRYTSYPTVPEWTASFGPRDYAARRGGEFATERGIVLTDDDRRRRAVIDQIMCNFWTDLGDDGAAYFAREIDELRGLESEGLLRVRGTEIDLTPLGRVFVRNVAMVFDAYLRRDPPAQKPRPFSRTV